MKSKDFVPSRYTRDKEIFEQYWDWHKSRYGTEPSTQQALLCCDWGLHLINNPPPQNNE